MLMVLRAPSASKARRDELERDWTERPAKVSARRPFCIGALIVAVGGLLAADRPRPSPLLSRLAARSIIIQAGADLASAGHFRWRLERT